MKKEKVVVIGGGIAGLTAAYLFSKDEKYEVHIIEKNDSLGGLLNSCDYGEYGKFDFGAHNILELKIKELDDFHLSLFPKEKWQKTTTINGQIRALSGLMYNKRLQKNMPFIDLRKNEKLHEYIGDFFLNLNTPTKSFEESNIKNAYDFSIYKFGTKITDEIIVPAIMKIHKLHPKKLSTMVMYLTQFSRVGLFEEHIMNELVHLPNIGSRLGFTEQQNLPEQYLENVYSLYPKEYGIYKVIDAIENKLQENNVNFHMNSTISNISLSNNEITKLTVNNSTINPDIVVNSIGNNSFAKLLNIDTSNFKYDKNPTTIITNILLTKPLNCGELCFINCYDKGSNIFRVDNYINYCSGAKRKGLYPISIETISYNEIDIEVLQKDIIRELQEYNMIEKNNEIKFIKTEELEYGFPCLSLNNLSINNELRERINKQEITNLINIGLLSEDNLFFESDVIKSAYNKIKNEMKRIKNESK